MQLLANGRVVVRVVCSTLYKSTTVTGDLVQKRGVGGAALSDVQLAQQWLSWFWRGAHLATTERSTRQKKDECNDDTVRACCDVKGRGLVVSSEQGSAVTGQRSAVSSQQSGGQAVRRSH